MKSLFEAVHSGARPRLKNLADSEPSAAASSNFRPTGLRRLSQALLGAEKLAGGFHGLPESTTTPGQVLAAFKAAAPFLGYSARIIHAVDWFFRFTQPQDWAEGARPVVWPSAAMQQSEWSLSATQVKALNRVLIELCLVTMKDSPNGKRYGRRNAAGAIVEAYGFDLSPLAARHHEFVAVAAHGRAERAETARLRRRATIARNGLRQILEAVTEYGVDDSEWRALIAEGEGLAAMIKHAEGLEELRCAVEALERQHAEARKRLEICLLEKNSDPLGSIFRPHNTYKPNSYLSEPVIASEESSRGEAVAKTHMWTAPACKGFLSRLGDLVGCGHMSGPCVRRRWPLALMEFADWVPIKSAR